MGVRNQTSPAAKASGKMKKRGEEKMDQKTDITGKFRFDQDSKRFHRFQIETSEGIVGTLADLRYSFVYAYLISYRGGYVDSNEKEVMV